MFLIENVIDKNGIYDVDNYALLGEVSEDFELERWSIAFCYYSLKKKWCVKETKSTKETDYTFYDTKAQAEAYYGLRGRYLKTVAAEMEKEGLTSKWAGSQRLMSGYGRIASQVYPKLSQEQKDAFLQSPFRETQTYNPKAGQIYDVENYALMGEIDETTKMGRWSVGYLCATRTGQWWVVETQGNEYKLASFFRNKESALEEYYKKAEVLKKIAQGMKENRIPGHIPTNAELKQKYDSLQKQILHDDCVRKEVQRLQNLEEEMLAYKEIRRLKDEAYIDYTNRFSREAKPTGSRKDYVWIKEDGDIVLQGEYGWGNDSYLIGSSIKAIDSSWGKIKSLIISYCQANRGHIMDGGHPDFDNNERLIDGYIRKEVDIVSLKAQEVKLMYEEALKNKIFPTDKEKREIASKIHEYNKRMGEIR